MERVFEKAAAQRDRWGFPGTPVCGSATIDRVPGSALRVLCDLPRQPAYVQLAPEKLAALADRYRYDRDEALVTSRGGGSWSSS